MIIYMNTNKLSDQIVSMCAACKPWKAKGMLNIVRSLAELLPDENIDEQIAAQVNRSLSMEAAPREQILEVTLFLQEEAKRVQDMCVNNGGGGRFD